MGWRPGSAPTGSRCHWRHTGPEGSRLHGARQSWSWPRWYQAVRGVASCQKCEWFTPLRVAGHTCQDHSTAVSHHRQAMAASQTKPFLTDVGTALKASVSKVSLTQSAMHSTRSTTGGGSGECPRCPASAPRAPMHTYAHSTDLYNRDPCPAGALPDFLSERLTAEIVHGQVQQAYLLEALESIGQSA